MKVIYLMVLFAIVISGCAGSASDSDSPITPMPTEDPRLKPLKDYAADKLGLKQSEIVLVSMIEEEWPDACLGLPEKDEMCAMVVTPGYLVIFNSPQGTLEFHTNQDISYFRMAPVGSLTTLVTWQRSGGFAGICQELKILSDNSYLLSDCSGSVAAQGVLIDADATELASYLNQYVVIDWFSTQPPGSADMFNDHFILYGKGESKSDDSQMVQLNEWLAELADKLKQKGTDL